MSCQKVRKGSWYVYEPVGLDIFDSRTIGIKSGDLVKVVHPHGCPPPNTMGMAHIETKDGVFAGLVLTNSLQPRKARS